MADEEKDTAETSTEPKPKKKRTTSRKAKSSADEKEPSVAKMKAPVDEREDDVAKRAEAATDKKKKKDAGKKKSEKKKPAKKTEKVETEKVAETAAAEERQLTPDELLEKGAKWLDGLFERMKLDLRATGRRDKSSLHYDLDGADEQKLLGRGQSPKTLESIQSLMRDALLDRGSNLTIHVDVGGFRQQREERLQSVARGLAAAAARIERPVIVAGLNSFERRVIHNALADHDEVGTESEGVGAFRKLRVEPRAD